MRLAVGSVCWDSSYWHYVDFKLFKRRTSLPELLKAPPEKEKIKNVRPGKFTFPAGPFAGHSVRAVLLRNSLPVAIAVILIFVCVQALSHRATSIWL